MKLNLKKPLAFLDVEATGLDLINDRLVELAVLKLSPNGQEERKCWRVNPERSIPEDISALIGITDDDLKDEPVFGHVAKNIAQFLSGCDLAGFNPFKLDLPLLMEEFLRVDIDFDISKRKVIDVQKIFHMMEKRNLAAALYFYCGKELNNHHSAMADTDATHDVFIAQLEKYEELGNDVDKVCTVIGNPSQTIVDIVGRIVKDDNGEEVFNFGKYKGRSVVDVLKKDPAYYGWMLNGHFTQYTKKKLTEIRLRMKNS